MVHKMVFKLSLCLFVLTLLTGSAASALGGGFQISVEAVPSGDGGPGSNRNVLLVHVHGCYQPTDAVISGTAEGIVNGKHESVPLDFIEVSTGYRINQTWPAQGAWVLAITGASHNLTSSALVKLGPDGRVPEGLKAGSAGNEWRVRLFQRKLTAGDIESALRDAEGKVAVSAGSSVSAAAVFIGLASITGLAVWRNRRGALL